MMRKESGAWLLVALVTSGWSQPRAAWMQEAKWGVMTHYLADWQTRAHQLNMSIEQWNKSGVPFTQVTATSCVRGLLFAQRVAAFSGQPE